MNKVNLEKIISIILCLTFYTYFFPNYVLLQIPSKSITNENVPEDAEQTVFLMEMNRKSYSLTQIPLAWNQLLDSTCQCNEVNDYIGKQDMKYVLNHVISYCKKYGKWDDFNNNGQIFAEQTYYELTKVEPFRKSFIII